MKKELLVSIALIICSGCNEQSSDRSEPIVSPNKDELTTLYVVGSSTMELMYDNLASQSTTHNIKLINFAQSGEKIYTNCLRLGALPGNVKFSNNLSEIDRNYHVDTDWPIDLAMRPFEVTINNIKGSLNVNNQGYYFKPHPDYQTLNLEVDIFYPISSNFKPESNSIFILNLGKNDLLSSNHSEINKEFKSCVDFIYKNYSSKIYLINHFSATDANDNLINSIKIFNTYIKSISPSKLLDLNSYLLSLDIWKDSNITPTKQDLENQKKLKLPPSLSRDSIHLNNETNNIIAHKIYEDLTKFKWIDQNN